MIVENQQLAALWDGLGCFCAHAPLEQRVQGAYRQLMVAQGYGMDADSRLYHDLVAAFAPHVPSDRFETTQLGTPIDPAAYDRIVGLYRALYLQLQNNH